MRTPLIACRRQASRQQSISRWQSIGSDSPRLPHIECSSVFFSTFFTEFPETVDVLGQKHPRQRRNPPTEHPEVPSQLIGHPRYVLQQIALPRIASSIAVGRPVNRTLCSAMPQVRLPNSNRSACARNRRLQPARVGASESPGRQHVVQTMSLHGVIRASLALAWVWSGPKFFRWGNSDATDPARSLRAGSSGRSGTECAGRGKAPVFPNGPAEDSQVSDVVRRLHGTSCIAALPDPGSEGTRFVTALACRRQRHYLSVAIAERVKDPKERPDIVEMPAAPGLADQVCVQLADSDVPYPGRPLRRFDPGDGKTGAILEKAGGSADLRDRACDQARCLMKPGFIDSTESTSL